MVFIHQLPGLGSASTPLMGEVLTGAGPASITNHCRPFDNASVSFQAQGKATGPYPGTFAESGGWTNSGGNPLKPSGSHYENFFASFVISSGTATIEGTIEGTRLGGEFCGLGVEQDFGFQTNAYSGNIVQVSASVNMVKDTASVSEDFTD